MSEIEVRDVPERSRFEAEVGGETAVLAYRRRDGRLYLVHTEVPAALSGGGVGSRLASYALDSARAEGVPVIPTCPFVAGYIRRHQEYLSLVPEAYARREGLVRG